MNFVYLMETQVQNVRGMTHYSAFICYCEPGLLMYMHRLYHQKHLFVANIRA